MDAHIEQVLKKLIDLDSTASQMQLQSTHDLKRMEEEWQREMKCCEDEWNKNGMKNKEIYENIMKQAEEEKAMIIEITAKKLEEMEKEFKRIKEDIMMEALDKILSIKGHSYE